MAGMRQREESALRWADVADAVDGDGILVTVRRSKRARRGSPAPEDQVVPLSPQMVGLVAGGEPR